MKLHVVLWSWLVLSPALVLAQEGRIEVPDGREFQQYKVLTLGLTDRWEFDLEQDEFVHCVVESGEFDPVLELLDDQGERYGRNDGEGTRSELTWWAPKKGRLTFAVQGYEGRGGGNYRFWLLRYRTERLAVGGAVEHEFGEDRWWHFRVAAKKGDVLIPRVPFGGQLTAVMDAGQQRLPEWHGGYTATGDGDVLLRVEGGEKSRFRVDVQLARQAELAASGLLHDEIPTGGMHVVRHDFAPGAWTFELDEPQHDLDIDFRDVAPGRHPRFTWTGQLNKNGRRRQWLLVREPLRAELVLRNHHGTAGYCGKFVPAGEAVTIGEPQLAQLPLGGGRLFRIDAKPGQLLRVAAASDAFDVRLDLWTPDGGVHGFDDRARLDLGAQHAFLVQQRGVHHALVYTSGGAGSGEFQLLVEDLPIPDLAVGAPLAVQIGGLVGNGYVHLSCNGGERLWLSLDSDAFDPALVVFDPDGAQVACFEGGGVGWNVLNGFEAQKAGVYTLQVVTRRGAGSGTLRAIMP
ncbi:MAG: PPC domain-containing protein [Planctomycetes bacterium]|nr:PPC domain-containing protein [Planctomycetota bacterium]